MTGWVESNGEYVLTTAAGRVLIVYQRGRDGLWSWQVDEADGDAVALGRAATLPDAQAAALAAADGL